MTELNEIWKLICNIRFVLAMLIIGALLVVFTNYVGNYEFIDYPILKLSCVLWFLSIFIGVVKFNFPEFEIEISIGFYLILLITAIINSLYVIKIDDESIKEIYGLIWFARGLIFICIIISSVFIRKVVKLVLDVLCCFILKFLILTKSSDFNASFRDTWIMLYALPHIELWDKKISFDSAPTMNIPILFFKRSFEHSPLCYCSGNPSIFVANNFSENTVFINNLLKWNLEGLLWFSYLNEMFSDEINKSDFSFKKLQVSVRNILKILNTSSCNLDSFLSHKDLNFILESDVKSFADNRNIMDYYKEKSREYIIKNGRTLVETKNNT